MTCKNCNNGSCTGCGMRRCSLSKVAKILLIVGGLNWGLIGLGGFMNSDWNLVHAILSRAPVVEWLVYLLVGISAVIKIFGCRCKMCKSADMAENKSQM